MAIPPIAGIDAMSPLLTAFALAASSTFWVSPPTQATVSLPLANEIADAAIAACSGIGQSAVVAVVDRGGNPVALQRGDDVGPHNAQAAQRKAFTALSTKSRTSVLASRAAADTTSQNLTTVPELLLLGGGVPITFQNTVIGGIGVAGAGGSANDESCALKALEATMPAD